MYADGGGSYEHTARGTRYTAIRRSETTFVTVRPRSHVPDANNRQVTATAKCGCHRTPHREWPLEKRSVMAFLVVRPLNGQEASVRIVTYRWGLHAIRAPRAARGPSACQPVELLLRYHQSIQTSCSNWPINVERLKSTYTVRSA